MATKGEEAAGARSARAGTMPSGLPERMYRLVVEANPGGGLYVVDRDLRFVFVGGRLIPATPWGSQRMLGRAVAEVVAAAPQLAMVTERYRRALSGEVGSYESWWGGRLLWSQYVPIAGESGEIELAACLIFDLPGPLRDSRLHALNQSLNDVLWVLDADEGRFRDVSPSVERLRGYTAAEVLAQPADEALCPASRALVAAAMAERLPRFLAGGDSVYLDELEQPCRNGTTVWTEATTRFVSNPDTGHLEVFGASRDITARRRAQQQLEAERKRLRTALDAAQLGTWQHDPRTGLLRIDARAREHLDSETDELPLAAILARMHPADRQRVADEMAAVLEPSASGAHTTEYRVITRTGETRVLAVHVRVEFEGEGPRRTAVVSYGTTQDVTEQRRAQEQVSRQSLLLRDAGELAHVGGWEFDPVTREGSWTEETARIHGVTTLSASTETGLRCFEGEARARIEAALEAAIAHGTPYDLELPFVAVDGTRKWVRAVCRPLVEQGRVVRVRGSLQDITERVELEARLRQSQKLEAIAQLAGGVAHDFNNLLTIIGGNAQMLATAAARRDGGQFLLAEIRDAAERAAALTRQLLAVSRAQVLAPQVVDVNEVVTGLQRMLRRLLGEAIVLECRLAPDAGHVLVDPGQLEQVLVNLAVNARDAMPVGGTMTLTAEAVDLRAGDRGLLADMAPGRYVRLAITDTGVGMTPDVRARIFDPFFTTKEKGQGMGLGLATVFGIVRQSGGYIDVRSEPGAGSSFEVFFPQVQAPRRSGPTPPPPTVLPGHETVLLVEDEEGVRRIAEIALASHGYRVLSASHGAAALEVAQAAGAIDLLVTDLMMPGMEGRELARALRERRPGLRVLYMSGYVEDELTRLDFAGGQDAFLAKPFSITGIAKRVREVLDGPPEPAS